MQKIGSSTTTADENGEFTDGDPQTQVPCTWVMAAWLNTLQRELVHLCEEAGITINPEDDTQVYQAIAQLLNTSTEGMVKTVNEHAPDEHGDVKLGSAADKNVTASARDATTDHVLKTADYGIGRTIGTVTTGIDFKSFVFIQGEHLFVKMDTCTNIPAGLNATTYYYIFVKGMRDSDGSPCIELMKYDNPSEVWNAYGAGAAGNRTWSLYRSYNTGYKLTAEDIGAMPYFGTALSVDLNTLGAYSAAGVHYQSDNGRATTANHYPVAEAGALLVLPSAYGCQQEYTTFGTGRKFLRGLSGAWNGANGPWGNWNELYGPTNPNEIVSSSANSYRIAYGNYGAFWRQDGGNLYLMLTNSGDAHGSYNNLRPFTVNLASGYITMGRLGLTDYTNFDARYGQKNTASLAAGGGWWQDASTGLIMQMGIVNRTGYSTSVTFPKAFPNFCIGVHLTLNMYVDNLDGSRDNIRALSHNNTGFAYGSNGDPEKTAFWVAFGK